MIGSFILINCGTLIRAFVNWYNHEELKSENEKANLRIELAMLKSQISPHFLFNTLNNIDALVHNDPNLASQAIIRLSEILRYMLYETDNEYVKLGHERHFLENLVELHRLRHRSSKYIQFETSIHNEDLLIAPLLLIPIVENAVKFSCYAGKEPVIDIQLSSSVKQFIFRCRNYFNPARVRAESSGGIGLKNVRQRLKAYYPGRHILKIDKKDDLYSVELIIENEVHINKHQ
jgi:LytS/YehU family sensor histidine kinase